MYTHCLLLYHRQGKFIYIRQFYNPEDQFQLRGQRPAPSGIHLPVSGGSRRAQFQVRPPQQLSMDWFQGKF